MKRRLRNQVTLLQGGGVSLDAFMASQSDGLFYDITKTDRHFQSSTALTLGDDVSEVIGLALDQRTWASGISYSAMVAAQPELVTNGDFASATGWTCNAGFSVTGGKLTGSGNAGGTNGVGNSDVAIVSGKTYLCTYTIDSITLDMATGVSIRLGSSVTGASRTSAGTYSEFLTWDGAGSAKAYLVGRGGTPTLTAISIDNVSIKEVPGKHALQATGSLKPVRQTTGAKFDGTDDNWLTPYLAGSTVNFVVALVTVPASLAATQVIVGATDGSSNRFFLAVTSSGILRGAIGSHATIDSSTDIRGQRIVVGMSCDGSTERLFVGDAVAVDQAQAGVPPPAVPFRIAALNGNGSPSNYFAGSVEKIVSGREFLTLAKYQQLRTQLLAA